MVGSSFANGYGLQGSTARERAEQGLSDRERLEHQLVARLRRAGATCETAATPWPDLDDQSAAVARHLSHAGIIKTTDGLCWLDETALGRLMRARLNRKKTLTGLALIGLTLIPVGALIATQMV